MSVSGQTVIQWLEQFAPKSLAVEGDKIGLQIGRVDRPVQKVLVTLDVTQEVVQEAIDKQIDLIIAHHPPIFRSLTNLRTDLPAGKLYAQLLKHDIAVYAAHTNLDIATGGVNDWLVERLGLERLEILAPTYTEPLKKLVVFVPVDQEQEVRSALGEAGAGWIGNYSHCSFRQEGVGSFLPLEGSSPHIGNQGKLEEVQEVRLETIFPLSLQKKIIQAMLKAHPYEEVAYDIYSIENQGKQYGLGRVGYLPEEMSLSSFAQQVKQAFDVPFCRVVGPLDKKVKKVAIVGGDGNKYVQAALFKGADVYVTGDIYFHTAQDALLAGLCMVDPGHHVEKVMIQGVQSVLQAAAVKHKQQVEIIASTVHTEPFTCL